MIAAFEAATPKISTGTVSGSTSTGSSNPPRRSATESAAPISPMQVSAGVPASSVSATAAIASRFEIEEQAEQRRRDDQRQAGGDPVRQRFRQHGEFERRASHQQQIERAVLVIGGEQPVEREQRGEQRADPQDRGADALEQREIGPDRERRERHHDEEEQHAHQRAAADAHGEAHVAEEESGEGGHADPPESQLFRLNPQRPMRRRDDHPAAGQVPAHQSGQHLLAGRIERRGRLVEQPERARDREQPGEREAAALAGRQVGGGQMAERIKADRGERRRRASQSPPK